MSLKEDIQFKDRLIKGIQADGEFKISVVKTTDAVQTAKENHQLSLLASVVLGRTMSAALLLASELKGEERIRLRLEGTGPLGVVTAEANKVGEVRGYVKNPTAELDYSNPDANIGDGLGAGLLTVTKVLYNEAEPRSGTIELVKGDVIGDVAHYLAQSEQVLSAILLDTSFHDDGTIAASGGVLIQRMPDAEEATMGSLQETVASLPPISQMMEEGLYIDDIMKAASKPFLVKELDRQPIDFFCRCSPERFKGALALLHIDELKQMANESQEMVCHFCGRSHTVSKEEMNRIVQQAKAKLN
ncbi:MAG: Hsp33 family molecular chaperone HslO [Balneolaceae bacterium]